jgi:hypothetical protein
MSTDRVLRVEVLWEESKVESLKLQSPNSRRGLWSLICERYVSTYRALRVNLEVLREEASVESLKILKPKEPESIIVVDLWEDTRRQIVNSRGKWEEASEEKLRLPKAEVPKWTRAIDLRWMCGARSENFGYGILRRKVEVESAKLPKRGVPKWILIVDCEGG